MNTANDGQARPLEVDPRRLADVLDLSPLVKCKWDEREFGDVLRHQLGAPLSAELASLGLPSTEPPPHNRHPTTLLELLMHPHPPLDLLRLAKEMAKACGSDPLERLPRPVAVAIYYIVVSLALMHHHEHISRQDQGQIRAGLRWVTTRLWLDGVTRRVARTCFDFVEGKRGQ